MSDTLKHSLKHSFKTSLPVMAGCIVLGIGFGVMMADRGFVWYRAALMSLTAYPRRRESSALCCCTSGSTTRF